MIRSRIKPDGLPFRLYERRGKRIYSIGYKMKNGRWAFRFECPIEDVAKIREIRRAAIEESSRVIEDKPDGGFAGLVDAWFEWQEALPESDTRKRAKSTITENRREAANLKKAWGHLEAHEITRVMAYEYLEACLLAKRPEKGNKEMALARLILEFAVRKGLCDSNPLDRLEKLKTIKERRRVTREEMDLATEVGRQYGGAKLIVALALRTAWLCLRRSVEVRALTRDAIKDGGILWKDGKTKTKPAVLIEWSPELKSVIDEAMAIKRSKVAGTMYVFGNMRGQKYTKGGWKAMLDDLMTACETMASDRKMAFKKFSLQDCRPMGVSDKLEAGHVDTQDATLHTDGKMIARVYDRRQVKKAAPAA